MCEAKERQKFISDAQYLREMQHKMDTEYQACLRKQEQTREQPEKKREQYVRQDMRQTSISSISAVRSYERPWISRLPVNRQMSSDEVSGCELKSSIKLPGNKSEAKFPAIDKTTVKQKQKAGTCSKKPEKSGTCPKKEISAFQKPVLSRRQRMSQRSLLENPDSENVKRVEGKGKKTLLLQGTAKISRGSGSQDGTRQRSTPKNKKKSQERRNLGQTSKLSIDGKTLDRDLKKGNVYTAAKQLSTHPTVSPVPIANGSLVPSDPNSSNLPPIKNVPMRPKEDESCAELCSNVEGSTPDNEDTKEERPLKEDLLSFDLNNSSCDQTNRFCQMSLTQAEHYTYEMGVGDDGQRVELSHRLVWQHNVAADPAAEPSLAVQKQTRDHRKSHAVEENLLEDNNKNEGEKSVFSTRSPCTASKPGSASASEPVGNLNSTEDWSGSSVCGRERQAFENNQRCYAGLISAVRPMVQRPSVCSTLNIPESLARPTNQAEASSNVDVAAAASVQVTELTGSPRLIARRQLSPLRMRDSFSATESCQSSSPTVSTFEDSSLLEDTLSNELSSASPSTASHDEDTLQTSHNSSASTDSSQPSLFRANFTAHLHMTGALSDQVPIFLTVSDLRNPSSFVSSASVCGSPNTKELNKPETDPEKLKKLQESLLAEDSEEEGDQCRICQIAGGSITNPLLEPCGCGGTLRFVHQECLKTWLKAKIKSGAELGSVKTCELCKQGLAADLDDFNVNDYYRNHQQSQAQSELMNSGLYLVLLLHLYEQRFAELMRLNYNQASRDRLSRQPRTEENQSSANSGNTS
ncbi:probable E3 ubiquitin-protein ligase MARCHF10 [Heteronotia binoei]|uniref:probable E3 ubiquitin-protein ligase MARCHF10 n=1 Tax=Heteronotia binoei TaxID=13085 RepID=UPI00292EB352|nr:probable E3 ubiquitin-protein ligase MARCHF10 [Heteronotia binoei]XP_060111811.1 probable E3 ubiquitin-protein ligase MARCHF10 [Heteronotia binoei]